MNFLEYSNKTQSNIIPQEEFHALVLEVFDVYADNLSKSLGPLGSSATILDGHITEATKDGFSIMKKYRFHNRYKRLVSNLIKSPCVAMNNTVGDGTTTSIILTKLLYQEMQSKIWDIQRLSRLPRVLNSILDDIVDELSSMVDDISKPINDDPDSIYNVAHVSSNGNKDISSNIKQIYTECDMPNIIQKDSHTNKSYIEKIVGYSFPTKLIEEMHINNDEMIMEIEKSHIMLFDFKITNEVLSDVIIPVNNVLRETGHTLIIIAPYYDKIMKSGALANYMSEELMVFGRHHLILTEYNIGKLKKHEIGDFSTILGSTAISQEFTQHITDIIKLDKSVISDDLYKFISISDKTTLSFTKDALIVFDNINNNASYNTLLSRCEDDLIMHTSSLGKDKQTYSKDIYTKRNRIAALKMNNYIYYVGADSSLQKQIIWDTIDDVIKCVKSASTHGVVNGCQISLYKSAKTLRDKYANTNDKYTHLKILLLECIMSALKELYKKIIEGPDKIGLQLMMDDDDAKLYKSHNNDSDEYKKIMADINNKIDDTIMTSYNNNVPYDISIDEYNNSIITSAETDKMVLSVSVELIKILISGNQCIFLDAEINGSHDDIMDV